MDSVDISKAAWAAILEHCCGQFPDEVCGLIAARNGVLIRAIPVPNIAVPRQDHCGFLMDPKAQFKAQREIEDAEMDMGGIYHSHPHSSASPSEQDVRLAAYPEAAYLVVSVVDLAHPDIRAWRIEDENHVVELRLDLVD